MKKETNKPVLNKPVPEKPLTAQEALGDTEAYKIWQEIKDKPISMFGLPNQVVSQYCVPIPVDPSKLFLMITASSVLPSLEATAGNKYVVELAGKYVVVSRFVDPLVRK
jgi:hypothetical protein